MQRNTKSPRNESTSPTSVPLPVSPPSSHGEFDALIELLATDAGSGVKIRGGQTDLRDVNGQLDFSKIRTMFASPNDGNSVRTPPPFVTSARQDTPRIDDISFHEGFEIGPVETSTPISDDPVDYPTSSTHLRTSIIPTLNLPDSYASMSSGVFDDDLPPAESTPNPTVRALQGGNITAMASVDPPWNIPSGRNTAPSLITPQSSTETLPSSFNSIKQALDQAQQEVIDLRQRCRELESLHATDEDSQVRSIDMEMARLNPYVSSPPLSQKFNTNKPMENTSSTPSPGHIHRALDMVCFVDELVWKRSRFGAEHDDPYSAENIQALQERLELWEKVVRTRR